MFRFLCAILPKILYISVGESKSYLRIRYGMKAIISKIVVSIDNGLVLDTIRRINAPHYYRR